MITKRNTKLLFIVISILIIIVCFSIYTIDNTNSPKENKKTIISNLREQSLTLWMVIR